MLALVLFLSAVSALPTMPPFVAVVPPGTNMTVTMEEGSHPPSILVPGMPVVPVTMFGTENMFHRVEFQFLDFQMNQTAPLATNLVQNVEIYVNMTFGPHKGFETGDTTMPTDGVFTSDIPNSVQGFTQLFTGLYNGGTDNKINIDRTMTADMCGLMFDKGYMDVWVRPINAATAGAFREGFYTCFFNLDMGTQIVHEGESRWSSIFQCNSGSLNNYSFRLWYQMRFYNIDSKLCQTVNFH